MGTTRVKAPAQEPNSNCNEPVWNSETYLTPQYWRKHLPQMWFSCPGEQNKAAANESLQIRLRRTLSGWCFNGENIQKRRADQASSGFSFKHSGEILNCRSVHPSLIAGVWRCVSSCFRARIRPGFMSASEWQRQRRRRRAGVKAEPLRAPIHFM